MVTPLVKKGKTLDSRTEALRQKVKELRNALVQHQNLLLTSLDAVVKIDDQGKIRFWNKSAEQVFGYSADQILGQPVTKLMAESFRERHQRALEDFLRDKRAPKESIEGQGLRKDGSTFPIRWFLSSWKEDGKTVVAAIGHDLTGLKKAEQRLEETEARYHRLCEGLGEAVALVRLPDLKFSYWNKRFEKLAQELIAKNIAEITIQDLGQLFKAEDWNNAMAMLAKSMAGEFIADTYTMELQATDLRGKRRVLEAKSSLYKDSGQVVGIQLLIADITERKQAEEALAASEARWRSLVENAPSTIMIIDAEGKIEFINRAAPGLNVQEMAGKSIYEYTPPAERDKLRKVIGEVFAAGKSHTFEARGLFPEGSWYRTQIAPFKQEQQIVGALLISLDITDLKRAEKALRESEERYRQLYEGITEAVAMFRLPDLKIAYWNKRFEKCARQVYGKDIGDILATDIVPSMEPEDWNKAMKALDGLLSHKPVPSTYEFRLKDQEGHKRMLEVRPSPYQEKGQTIGIQVMIRDITKLKQTEEQLRESEERYRNLFENSIEAVFTSDLKGRITGGNRALEELTGYSLEELIGMDWKKTVPRESVEAILREYDKLLRTGEPIRNIVYETVRKDGQRRITEGSVTLLKKENQIVGFQGTVRDITERRKAEEELRRSFVNLAETVSRAFESRDSFTAGHQRGVAELARLVGKKLGLDEHRTLGLYIGGLLHDIGKISIPASILTKPGELTEEEWALIRAHTKQGYRILKDTNFPWPIADMALHHHERLDGSGYPHGINGDKLSLEVRILAVCDVVEAMGAHRPYRPARSKRESLEEIRAGRGTKYDATVVDVMLEIIEKGEFKFGRNGRNSNHLGTAVPVP